jgi:hypothetical protein
MVGDYISTSISGNRATSVFAVGLPATASAYDEAMYAPASRLPIASASEATRASSTQAVVGPITGAGTGETHHDLKSE